MDGCCCGDGIVVSVPQNPLARPFISQVSAIRTLLPPLAPNSSLKNPRSATVHVHDAEAGQRVRLYSCAVNNVTDDYSRVQRRLARNGDNRWATIPVCD